MVPILAQPPLLSSKLPRNVDSTPARTQNHTESPMHFNRMKLSDMNHNQEAGRSKRSSNVKRVE